MKYLFYLLIPIGITLLTVSIIRIIRFANAKMVYEMFCADNEGIFTIKNEGEYGLWLSGKLFRKSPAGEFGFEIINQRTKRKIPLSTKIMRTTVTGIEKGRTELYSFYAEKGTYIITFNGESSTIDKLSGLLVNAIYKQPVDYSMFTVQVREHNPAGLLVLYIFGIIFGAMATISGIILPNIL